MKIEIRDHDHALYLACIWIEMHLDQGPQQVSELVKEFCKDTVRKELSDRIDLLNEARRILGIEAYIGDDDRFSWSNNPNQRHSQEYTQYLRSPT